MFSLRSRLHEQLNKNRVTAALHSKIIKTYCVVLPASLLFTSSANYRNFNKNLLVKPAFVLKLEVIVLSHSLFLIYEHPARTDKKGPFYRLVKNSLRLIIFVFKIFLSSFMYWPLDGLVFVFRNCKFLCFFGP